VVVIVEVTVVVPEDVPLVVPVVVCVLVAVVVAVVESQATESWYGQVPPNEVAEEYGSTTTMYAWLLVLLSVVVRLSWFSGPTTADCGRAFEFCAAGQSLQSPQSSHHATSSPIWPFSFVYT